MPLRLERRDHVLAVGDGGARGPGAVVVVRRLVRLGFARRLLPHHLAVLAVDRHHHEAVHAAARQPAPRRMRVADAAPAGRGQHVDAVAPDHRRRRAAAGISTFQRTFFDSLHSVGGCRRRRDAGHLRPAPLGPELIGALLGRRAQKE